MKVLDKIKNVIKEHIEYEKEQEVIYRKARERKENSVKEQANILKKCHICGSEDYIQSRGIVTYNAVVHEYTFIAKINMIADKEKYPDGGSYSLNAKICRTCGNVMLYVPFHELNIMYFCD